jgi:hypothetical protein
LTIRAGVNGSILFATPRLSMLTGSAAILLNPKRAVTPVSADLGCRRKTS